MKRNFAPAALACALWAGTLAAQIIERKTLDLVLQSADYEDVQVGAEPEKNIGTVEQQAVHGEMKDPTATPATPTPIVRRPSVRWALPAPDAATRTWWTACPRPRRRGAAGAASR